MWTYDAKKLDMTEFPYKQVESTELEKRGFRWCMLDQLDQCLSNRQNDPVFILNLDYMGKNGTHWTVVALDYKRNFVYYYDPLGKKNDNKYGHNDTFEEKTSIPQELALAAVNNGYTDIFTNEFNN